VERQESEDAERPQTRSATSNTMANPEISKRDVLGLEGFSRLGATHDEFPADIGSFVVPGELNQHDRG
jgi:hypothetical protein